MKRDSQLVWKYRGLLDTSGEDLSANLCLWVHLHGSHWRQWKEIGRSDGYLILCAGISPTGRWSIHHVSSHGSSLVHTRACNLCLPSGASGELNLACRWYRRHCLLEKGVSYFIPGFNEVTNVSLCFISMWLLYFSQLSIKGCLTETECPGLCVSVIYMQGRSLPSCQRDDWCPQPSAQGSFIALKQLGVWVLSAGALPWSNRPFSGASKPVPNLGCARAPPVAQFTNVANSTKSALWTNRRPSGSCGAWPCAKPVQQQMLLLF